MNFNSSLNRFGNLRDNQYRELINDEFNDPRSQVIARQFAQTRQFLESYEREKVGDRLVNLEVAKTISAFNSAIIKSTNDIDNNKPNSEEGIIVAYRVAIDMLDAYINASGTKTRDTERYRTMLYQSIPALNTYFEKASQIDKIGYVNTRELEKIAEIINRLEAGYSRGQTVNGRNIAANVVMSSLDEEANNLFKNLQTNYQILSRLYQVNKEILERVNKNGNPAEIALFNSRKTWVFKVEMLILKKVVPLLDFYRSGRIDYKSVAELLNINIMSNNGKNRKNTQEQFENREKTISLVINNLTTYLNDVKKLISQVNDPNDAVNAESLPTGNTAPATIPFNPAQGQQGQAPAQGQAESAKQLEAELEILYTRLYNAEKTLEKQRDSQDSAGADVTTRTILDIQDNIATKIASLQFNYNYTQTQLDEIKAKGLKDSATGSGRKRGGVGRTYQSSRHANISMRNDALAFEKRTVKNLNEEPSLRFINLYPNFQSGVVYGTEGSSKYKSRRSKNVILFDRI